VVLPRAAARVTAPLPRLQLPRTHMRARCPKRPVPIRPFPVPHSGPLPLKLLLVCMVVVARRLPRACGADSYISALGAAADCPARPQAPQLRLGRCELRDTDLELRVEDGAHVLRASSQHVSRTVVQSVSLPD
jgi:hypothetical protein